jgi:integrase
VRLPIRSWLNTNVQLRSFWQEVYGRFCSNGFGFHNLRHALTSFLVEIGTDPKTIQDMLRWADPSILLKVYAHSRMDKRMEAQAKMIEAMGLSEETARQVIR